MAVVGAIEELSPESLESVLGLRAGLLIGPDVTVGSCAIDDCNHAIAERFGVTPKQNLWETAEHVDPADVGALFEFVREYWHGYTKAPGIRQLASTLWRVVLSMTPDAHFDREYADWLANGAARGGHIPIVDPNETIPPRTNPILKLFGDPQSDTFPVTRNDLDIQRAKWQQFASQMNERLKGAPLVCVGLGSVGDLAIAYLSQFIAHPVLKPSRVIFLASDSLIRQGRLDDLARRGLRVSVTDSSPTSIVNQINALHSAGGTPLLAFSRKSTTEEERLAQFHQLAIIVNHLSPTVSKNDIGLLTDILFSPGSASWDPFFYGLDLKRTISRELVSTIVRPNPQLDNHRHAIHVTAPSASGKTTLLKRVALDLVDHNCLVVWIRSYFYQDAQSQLLRLFEHIRDIQQEQYGGEKRQVVIFIDDPIRLGTLTIDDISSTLEIARLHATLVFGTRTVEQYALDADIAFARTSPVVEVELPETLDDHEVENLPGFLFGLGIARTIEEADALVRNAASRRTDDVLSTLFVLIPDARESIAESVRDEYLRLGDRRGLTEVILGTVNHTSSILQDAYSLVAVGQRYADAVPIEVLVSALDVSYDDWLTEVPGDSLHWGLLYPDSDALAESTVYRTRNETVADIIVRQVNGGSIRRDAEVALLKRLLASCRGQSPAYREFALRVLVPTGDSPLRSLEPEQGDALFDAAIDALPHEDATLLHQKGIWQRKRMRNPVAAEVTFRRALTAKAYPYSDRAEAQEHIYTSLAANVRDKIRDGHITVDDGIDEALQHLDRGRSAKFVNPNATHVHASVISDLAALRAQDQDADFFALIEMAIRDIDRMLILLDSVFTDKSADAASRQMLEQKKDELLDQVYSDDDLERVGREQWQLHHRLDALVVLGRRHFRKARRDNKGKSYKAAWEYCGSLFKMAHDEGVAIPVPLSELMLQILVQWQVKRQQSDVLSDKIATDVDWEQILALASSVLETRGNTDDPLYMYIQALALAHLGRWGDASVTFGKIRRMGISRHTLLQPRDLLLSSRGGIRRIEGKLHVAPSSRLFLHSDELQTDMIADAFRSRSRDGERVNAYVRFAFAGPQAVPEP